MRTKQLIRTEAAIAAATVLAAVCASANPYVIMPNGQRVQGSAIRLTMMGDVNLVTPQGIRSFEKGTYLQAVADEPVEYKQAISALAEGNYDVAENLFKDIATRFRGLTWDVEATRMLARVSLAKGDGEGAVQTYTQLSRMFPKGAHAKDSRSETKAGRSKAETTSPKDDAEGYNKFLRWLNPHAETMWEKILQAPEHYVLQRGKNNLMKNVDPDQAQGQLEAFGIRYMPNAYAQYQEVREKRLELAQTIKENFPQGKASDPTGGTMFDKALKNCAMAKAREDRRRDELCFFLLFHQAGIFSEEELAEFDSHPIVIHLEPESPDWPDDRPIADTSLAAEDATFAAKYLPETHAEYQRLCGLFDEGAKQYADLRQTALALGAPRARLELAMLKTRLEEIQSTLQQCKKDLSVQRLEHALGETTAESLASLDHVNAMKFQEFEQRMEIKTYVAQAALSLIVTLPEGKEFSISGSKLIDIFERFEMQKNK